MSRLRGSGPCIVLALALGASACEDNPGQESTSSAVQSSTSLGSSASGTASGSTDATSSDDQCGDEIWQGDVVLPMAGFDPRRLIAVRGDLTVVLGSGLSGDAFACIQRIDGSLDLSQESSGNRPTLAPLPRFARLTNVGGDLDLHDLGSAVDLDFLPALVAVQGSLLVTGNPGLLSLHGLASLSRVGAQVLIGRNLGLRSLAGLGGLVEASELLVLDNDALIDVRGVGPLAQLKRLKLADNQALTTLAGLESLRDAQALVLRDNPSLTDLGALRGLVTVGDELELMGMGGVTSLAVLRGVLAPPLHTRIAANPRLATLAGLEAWTTIAAEHELVIEDNPSLLSLTGLGLQQVFGALTVRNNPGLTDLAGLRALHTAHKLVLIGPDHLRSLDDLAALGEVSGELVLARHPDLSSLDGLAPVVRVHALRLSELAGFRSLARLATGIEVDSLSLSDLPSLLTLAGLEGRRSFAGGLALRGLDTTNLRELADLETVGGLLDLERMPGLADLADLAKLHTAGGVVLAHNPGLRSLKGLAGLRGDLKGPLCVHNNPVLEDVEALRGLRSIAASLTFSANPALRSFAGIESVERIGASFWLDGDHAVSDLAGFRGLREVGAQVWSVGDDCASVLGGGQRHGYMGIEIRDMPMQSLRGLEELARIGGGIMLKENPQLTDLSALYGAQVNGEVIEIRLNSQLDQCHALGLPAQFATFAGETIRIEDNLGANDPECR